MKNSILAILALVSIAACEKKETVNTGLSSDSTEIANEHASTETDSLSAQNNETSATSITDKDKKFADAAAQGGIMEVMLGELAATNGYDPSVKALGEMMAKDHGKANDELKSWASKVGYTLPDAMNTEQQKMYDELKKKKELISTVHIQKQW